ncbi:MAG: hypothetical protein COB02_13090 [Candidatus Cloacimonadota bacterium]|nr:MAG: hypothetical protein COB02_13090 [Candidatus Cloacimonadota bacterium]
MRKNPLFETKNLKSKDINDHFDEIFSQITESKIYPFLLESNDNFFDILWESDYLYAGDGPQISARAILTMASLNASMGFDIYDIYDGSLE